MFKNCEHFSNKILVLGLEFTKCVSDYETGKTLGLPCLSRLFWQANSVKILDTVNVLKYLTLLFLIK